MRTVRRISQVIFFCLFFYTFIMATYPLESALPFNLFFMLSPLAAVITILSIHKVLLFFIPALLIMAAALLLGRFFCGWMCPLGAILDAGRRLLFSRRQGESSASARESLHRWISVKYYILIFILAASLFALSPGYIMEPISILFRTFTFVFFPVLFLFWQKLSLHFLFLMDYPPAPSEVVVFRGGLLFLMIGIIIIMLERISKRFWCRSLCPMGALLALCSRFSLLSKKVASSCVDCGLCRSQCKTGAIYPGNEDFLPSECIYCYECEALCPVQAISFKYKRPLPFFKDAGRWLTGRKKDPAITRRGFLLACTGGIGLAFLGEVDYGRTMKCSRLIRPPGALPEREFLALCLRCGECMKVCVTNGLQPAMLEAGFSGMWTPRLVPLRGYCEENCTFCSQICPSGAIKPIKVEDKKNIPIGVARINRSSCIAWNQGLKCLVCDEHCSYDAINWQEVEGKRRPLVDQDRCVGCGICENKCPTAPDPAIVVYARGEKRQDIYGG